MQRWSRTFRLLRNISEFLLVLFLLCLFRTLPVDWASALGGKIGRSLGPILPVTRRARHNLTMAFQGKTPGEIETIVEGMWENLGRTAAEYPHLRRLRCYGDMGRIEIRGTEILDRVQSSGEPHIFFSGHFANLELEGTSITGRNMPLTIVYRAANNPLVDLLLRQIRKHGIGATFVPKGSSGARELIAALEDCHHIGLLVDQKMNDGISVPFFSRDAMTAPALAQLALKYDKPVIPLQIERLQGASFRITLHPPLEILKSGDRETDVFNIMLMVNETLEDWIRQQPEQWFWLHNRWGD